MYSDNNGFSDYALGLKYERGDGVPQDFNAAFGCYCISAKKGCAEGEFALGVCYANGRGTEKNLPEAVQWYLKSAEKDCAAAQFNLGYCYENALGVERDCERAAYWYGRAAELGDADAQFHLSYSYMDGDGVERDFGKAAYWCKKAAEHGLAGAQYNLGVMYDRGQGVEYDPEKAAFWYSKAAEQGDMAAQYNLGVCYLKGSGVPRNVGKAAELFALSAAQGYADAQYNLALCYCNGYGVERNFNEARRLLTLSAAQGKEEAAATLEKLPPAENYAPEINPQGVAGNAGEKRRNGFGFRLAQAIIYTLLAVVYILIPSFIEGAPGALLILGAVCAVLAAASFVFAFVGRKKKWANIACIVLNCIFIGGIIVSIWGIIGGALGVKSLTPVKQKKEKNESAENPVKATAEDTAQTVSYGSEVENGECSTSVANVKEPNKRIGLGLLIGTGVYYLIWLVLGILSAALPEKGIAWGPYEDINRTVAMNVFTGAMMILLIPSFGYFFVFRGPVRLSKKVSAIIVAACFGATVLGDVLLYALSVKYLSQLGFTMKIAPVLSQLGLIFVYLSGFFKIAPEKLAKTKYVKTGNVWKDIFNEILCVLINFMKFLMKNRNKTAFLIAGTVLFTLCSFCLLEALYVLAAIMLVLLFILLLQSLYVPTVRHQYTVSDSSATLRTLSYDGYNGFTGEDIYKDEIGNTWATTNGGASFYPIAADNDRHYGDSADGKRKDY